MSAERNRNNIGMNDLQNLLFLHPSKGPGSLAIQEKLIAARNYRSWRRAVEIGLATERKLGFVQGTVTRSSDDPVKAKVWDTCNSILFQFLNGLDEVYGSQSSQMLLMTPLLTLEMACSMLQQEETQREVLEFNKVDVELAALYGRNEDQICS
ncbi:hypothetical protein Cgig2_011624 [Carnegiea gigantea]|uniref:Retrotransposon Copia-like N-terminal domain-containing protein n=1 Tax=Carnegiea gigantea TaxID=171969 RepID=A0A9Q1GL79_9CARY|nr:hypothetical protein Cgig2_011624 [Carnegiea gigantea]